MKYQTTTSPSKLFFGSGKLFISDYVEDINNANWNEVGSLSALSATDSMETATPEAVNAKHNPIVIKESSVLTFTMQEMNPELFKKCMGDVINVEIQTSAEVADYEQAIKPTANVFLPFENQNVVTSQVVAPTSISMTKDDIAFTEFETVKSGDVWGVVLSTVEVDSVYKLTYTYNPISKYIITGGGATEISPKMVKIVNEQSNGKKIEIVYFKCLFAEGGSMTLAKDGDATIIETPFTLNAELDFSRPAGQQLYQKSIM